MGSRSIPVPVVTTFPLLRLSGVALPEKTFVTTRAGCKEHMEITGDLLPWFPLKRQV
jgi:hypothetical protein